MGQYSHSPFNTGEVLLHAVSAVIPDTLYVLAVVRAPASVDRLEISHGIRALKIERLEWKTLVIAIQPEKMTERFFLREVAHDH